MVSQALFGEAVDVLKSLDDWLLIQTPDGYQGWAIKGCFSYREIAGRNDLEVNRLSAHVYHVPDTEFGPILTLAFGSKLELFEILDSRWYSVVLPDGKKAFIQKGDVEPEPFDLVIFSKKFLGIPYTWGGRSSFGFDCSGFVQMLYARLGLYLPRDAAQQVQKGSAVKSLRQGDLIFWGHSEGEILHVGMFLDGEEFIHTSVRENRPYLRISRLNDSEWSGSGFYRFRTARRFLNLCGKRSVLEKNYLAKTQKKSAAAAIFAPKTRKIL